MAMNNTQLYQLAKGYLKSGGRTFRNFCGLPSNAAWCAAFVSYIFSKGGDASLFYGGKKVVYVPAAETWMRANLAEIPLYLAMPMDVITFDWNNNGIPDHIGFVRDRKSATEIYTIEGNTSGGIVDFKTRPKKYVSGVFRPQFAPTSFTTLKALEIDGQFGYNSIACFQLALRRDGYYKGKIDAILGKETVKALQKKVGVAQDGSWGIKTTKAVQKWLNIKVTGLWDINSTKSLQRWCNQFNTWYAKKHGLPVPIVPAPKPQLSEFQKNTLAFAKQYAGGKRYHYVVFDDDEMTQICPFCWEKEHGKKLPLKYFGGNCIKWSWGCLHHGGGVPCRHDGEVINNQMGDNMLHMSNDEILAFVRARTGVKDWAIIKNSNGIPVSQIKPADLLMYYEGGTHVHQAIAVENGLICDCARGHSPQCKYGVPYIYENGVLCKIAIRYIGK